MLSGQLTTKQKIALSAAAVCAAAAVMLLLAASEERLFAGRYILLYAVCGISITTAYYIFPSLTASRSTFLIILCTGLVYRAFFFASGPVTSNDHYRYLWEGKLISNGVSPYFYAPGDSALSRFAEQGYPAKVAFPRLQSLYPPLAQVYFSAAYLIGGFSMGGLKLLALLCEAATLYLLYLLLLRYKLPVKNLILYAWFPLPVFEFFINNHIDAAGLPLLLASLLFYEKEKTVTSAFFFAGAVLVKLTPLFLLPLFFFSRKGLKYKALFTATAFAVIAAGYLPFLLMQNGMGSGLLTYMSKWEFNGALYSLLKYAGTLQNVLRIVLYAVLGGGMLGIALLKLEMQKKLLYGYILILLTATTAYPWYFSWMNIFAVLSPSGAVLYLLNALNLSNLTPYYFEAGKGWHEYGFVLAIEYIPFVIWLVLNIRKDLQQNSRVTG